MIRKTLIVNVIFFIALCYIISPWFFEKRLLFNELLSATGLLLLIYHRFRIEKSQITIYIIFLLLWCAVHGVTSLVRMDSLYFYLRNFVIAYSILAFFIGYYCFKYLGGFISKIRKLLQVYIGILLVFPLSRLLFERFGMALLFPALFRNATSKWLPVTLIILNFIYSITYHSFTAFILALFYILLFISPGYKFFKQVLILGFGAFLILFIYLLPYLSLISKNYSHYTYTGIYTVMRSHPLLALDGNSSWRLVLWKQIIVDNFPANIFGLGFGTPALKYFPVENYENIASLPYVLGAHNSYVYLFGRLGIVYILLILPVYIIIFKEFFYHKRYYYNNNQILLFFSFFASSVIALFNPALESPIYASGYWLLLGFIAKAIQVRRLKAF